MAGMDQSTLRERVQAVLDAGGGQTADGHRFLPLITLESGGRYGLDADLRWLVVSPDGAAVSVFTPSSGHLMHEALEWKREAFDGALEAAARSFDLPVDDVVFSFPVFDVIRAVFARKSSYMTRLALQWLRPTELRELRADIKAILDQPNMPRPVKDLAERLVVPE
jgi:hypothetical protein